MTVGASTQTLVSVNGQGASKFPQYLAAIIATLGGFVMGSVLGWTSPANPKLPKDYFAVSDMEKSLIGGLVSIGAMFGALCGGSFSSYIGRKRGMVALALPACVGWGCIIWADTVGMVIAGRVILGVVSGVLTVICPQYTTEIAETSIRGTLGTYFQLQCTLGIFFDYVVGNVVESLFAFNIICAVFPLLLAFLMTFMPETPHFYLGRKNEIAARKSLQFLRGKHYDVTPEIQAIQGSIEKVESEKMSFTEAFSTTPAKRGLIIGIGIMFFQQLCGINGVIFYSSDIFQSAGSKMSPASSTMIVGGVSVVATYISTLIIDRLGRKPLLFISDAVCAVSTAALGLYFYLQETGVDVSNIGWLPVTSLSVFIIMFSLGLGPIPWMFLTEIFPPSIKGPASSIACLSNWLFCFAVTFGFDPVCKAIHQSFTFWLFSIISILGSIFVLMLVPETKGKSLDEVQYALGGDPPANHTTEKPSRIA